MTISLICLLIGGILQSSLSLAPSSNYRNIPPTTKSNDQATTRRSIIKSSFIFTSAAFVATFNGDTANALEQCRPKSRNCVRTVWTAPTSVGKDQAIETIKNVLNTYPQNGQNGIDCNGWSIVEDALSSSTDNISSLRLEFKSCVGPAALAINLAQPFIDDVKIEIAETDVVKVEVKSSSRMGSSDLFVNKKRIEFLGDQLRQQGWAVPEVKYGK